jgi:hypothetical protein
MKYYNLLYLAIIFVACSNTPKQSIETEKPSPLAKYFNAEWANNSHWYDGLAEVATYQAQRTIYNKERNFEYTYITVAEDFNKEFRVKTDDYNRKDLYKVMKVNAFCKIETDNYPYHFLTSMFLPFATPWAMDKMTNGSQEWCGNTFKEYLAGPADYQLTYHSYWDGEGDGSTTINKDVLFEDQLNYTLRSLNFKEGLTFDAKVLECQISSKVGKLKIYNSKIIVTDGSAAISNTWKVSMMLENGKENVYYFKNTYPNLLVKQNTWDNRSLVLLKTSRYAYWKN